MQYMPMTNKSENTDEQRKKKRFKPPTNLAHPKTTSVNTLNTLTTRFCRMQCAELEHRLCVCVCLYVSVWQRGRERGGHLGILVDAGK